MATNSVNESDATPPAEESVDFDDDTLRAIAEVFKNEGNDEYRKKNFTNAIYFYTEGIQVKCKDEELNAKLYNNRATANFYFGNYHDSLSDAKAATELQPTYLKAIVQGASACVQLNHFEETITWCDKGLAIDKNYKKLLQFRALAKANSKSETKASKGTVGTLKFTTCGEAYDYYGNLGDSFFSTGDVREAVKYYNLSLRFIKGVGDTKSEGFTYSSLGNCFYRLGDFKKAIQYHNLHLIIAKEVGDKAGEGTAYGNLGDAFDSLGDLKKAIDYHDLSLSIAKEVGDKAAEGTVYGDLGNDYQGLGNFKKAIDYHNLHLTIAKEVGDRAGEGIVYGNLGNALQGIGDFKKAINYHNLSISIAKEVGNKAGEGGSYGNLGIAFHNISDFKKAISYYNLSLSIVKEARNKANEGKIYGNLGTAYQDLGHFENAIEYHNLSLRVAKEVGDKAGEGSSYSNIGNVFRCLGDFKKAIDYFNLHLSIAKEMGDKAGEGKAYGNLGIVFSESLGDFKKALDYFNLDLSMAKEVGNKSGEGKAYINIGNVFRTLGDFEKATDYYNRYLSIAKEVGNKACEGKVYGNLGNVFQSLGDFKKAIDYYNLHLSIAKEVGDEVAEGKVYGNLGIAFRRFGDLQKAMDCHILQLNIANKVGNKANEVIAYHALGCCFEMLGHLPEALECYRSGVTLFTKVRDHLQSNDEWKIYFRNKFNVLYTGSWRVLLKQDKIDQALFAAEEGRAQALTDLIESKYGIGARQSGSPGEVENCLNMLSCTSSNTIFQAVDEGEINSWVLSEEKHVHFRRQELKDPFALDCVTAFFQSLIQNAYKDIGVRTGVLCEDRSMDAVREDSTDQSSDKKNSEPSSRQKNSSLSTLYNIVIKPIADLVNGEELIIVPDGPLWLAPYAAFMDSDSKYLCESFRIRLIPSLTSLKMIVDCPEEYHCKSGALLVGDPWVQEVTNSKGKKLLKQLKFAKQEVEMIGQILNVTPLTGREASKAEVLKRLSSVALVHIAAHGAMETGEISLTPDPERSSLIPTKEDYVLTMADVLSVQLRARLVVLSCCHSGRGEIKAEGVVGIARAFMGAGARSVLVSLWAIDDEATLEFMTSFYHHLVEGRSASESLNQAIKYLRESDKYSDVKYWAPYVLIGDDVNLKCDEH